MLENIADEYERSEITTVFLHDKLQKDILIFFL